MASGLFSSLQLLSGKLLDAIRGSQEAPNQTKSIEDDLKWLNRMLQRIEAVQQDAEEREIRDHSVELWLRELRGVAHKAEDVLGEYHYEMHKSIVENRSTAIGTSHSGANTKIEEVCTLSASASSSSNVSKLSILDGMNDKIKSMREHFEEMQKAHMGVQTTEGILDEYYYEVLESLAENKSTVTRTSNIGINLLKISRDDHILLS